MSRREQFVEQNIFNDVSILLALLLNIVHFYGAVTKCVIKFYAIFKVVKVYSFANKNF